MQAVLSDLLLVPLLPSVPDLVTIPKLLAFTAALDRTSEMAAVLTRIPPRSAQRVEFARQTLARATTAERENSNHGDRAG